MNTTLEPTYEERARIASKEAQAEIIRQTNAEYGEFQLLGEQAAEKLIEFVNKGRAVGLKLKALRADNRHWEQLTLGMHGIDDLPRLNFSERYGKGFIRMAERLPEPATTMEEAVSSMRDALQLQGTLPFAEPHSDQRLHNADPFATITRSVIQIQSVWNKDIQERVAQMTPEEKQFKRAQIEPVVRIWEALAA